jgi:hypothetical protein
LNSSRDFTTGWGKKLEICADAASLAQGNSNRNQRPGEFALAAFPDILASPQHCSIAVGFRQKILMSNTKPQNPQDWNLAAKPQQGNKAGSYWTARE